MDPAFGWAFSGAKYISRVSFEASGPGEIRPVGSRGQARAGCLEAQSWCSITNIYKHLWARLVSQKRGGAEGFPPCHRRGVGRGHVRAMLKFYWHIMAVTMATRGLHDSPWYLPWATIASHGLPRHVARVAIGHGAATARVIVVPMTRSVALAMGRSRQYHGTCDGNPDGVQCHGMPWRPMVSHGTAVGCNGMPYY